MKQIALFSLLILFVLSSGLAQKKNLRKAKSLHRSEQLLDAKKEIEPATTHEDTKNYYETFFVKGMIYQDMYQFNAKGLYRGMGAVEAKLIMRGDPAKKEALENGEKWIYEKVSLTFQTSPDDPKQLLLAEWEELESLHENPLPIAWQAYQKALDLCKNEKRPEKCREEIKQYLPALSDQFRNAGVKFYYDKKLEKAIESYTSAVEVNELIGKKDSSLYYYAGIAALESQQHEKALKFFEQAQEHDFDTHWIYHYKSEAYKGLGQSKKQLAAIKTGFEKYPEQEQLMIDLINYYLAVEQADKAIAYLDMAIKKNPKNPSYYFAKATLYDKSTNQIREKAFKADSLARELKKAAFRVRNQPEEHKKAQAEYQAKQKLTDQLFEQAEQEFQNASQTYKKAAEIDPKFFDAYYNLGVLYYYKAESFNTKADRIPFSEDKDGSMVKKLRNKALDVFAESAKFFEKAHTIKPKQKSTLEILSNIYAKLRSRSDEMMNKWKETREKLENL